jgi:serine/threonine protein kinase
MEIRIAGRYKLTTKIGKGAFGEIYEGIDKLTQDKVACKLEYMKTEFPQVLYEAKILRLLQGEEGIPVLFWAGQEGEYNIMVTEMLGPSIEDMMQYCN